MSAICIPLCNNLHFCPGATCLYYYIFHEVVDIVCARAHCFTVIDFTLLLESGEWNKKGKSDGETTIKRSKFIWDRFILELNALKAYMNRTKRFESHFFARNKFDGIVNAKIIAYKCFLFASAGTLYTMPSDGCLRFGETVSTTAALLLEILLPSTE